MNTEIYIFKNLIPSITKREIDNKSSADYNSYRNFKQVFDGLLSESSKYIISINQESRKLMLNILKLAKKNILAAKVLISSVYKTESSKSNLNLDILKFLHKKNYESTLILQQALKIIDTLRIEITSTSKVNLKNILNPTQIALIGEPSRIENIIKNAQPMTLDFKKINGYQYVEMKDLDRYLNLHEFFADKIPGLKINSNLNRSFNDEIQMSQKTVAIRYYKLKKYHSCIELIFSYLDGVRDKELDKTIAKIIHILGKAYYKIEEYQKAHYCFHILRKYIESVRLTKFNQRLCKVYRSLSVCAKKLNVTELKEEYKKLSNCYLNSNINSNTFQNLSKIFSNMEIYDLSWEFSQNNQKGVGVSMKVGQALEKI